MSQSTHLWDNKSASHCDCNVRCLSGQGCCFFI